MINYPLFLGSYWFLLEILCYGAALSAALMVGASTVVRTDGMCGWTIRLFSIVVLELLSLRRKGPVDSLHSKDYINTGPSPPWLWMNQKSQVSASPRITSENLCGPSSSIFWSRTCLPPVGFAAQGLTGKTVCLTLKPVPWAMSACNLYPSVFYTLLLTVFSSPKALNPVKPASKHRVSIFFLKKKSPLKCLQFHRTIRNYFKNIFSESKVKHTATFFFFLPEVFAKAVALLYFGSCQWLRVSKSHLTLCGPGFLTSSFGDCFMANTSSFVLV